MDRHYHPQVYVRLKALFGAGDWDALQAYLSGLSNAHFRTAGYMIGERLLMDVGRDAFWDVSRRLILWQPKAFTVTIAKSAATRLRQGSLSLTDSGFEVLAKALEDDSHAIDRQKFLLVVMSEVKDYELMERLFASLGVNDARRRVDFLLRTGGLTAAFVLLRSLRYEEHDKDFLTNVCRDIIRRASTETDSRRRSLGFNLASLLRSFFDLPDIRGTFSLALEAYELSSLDSDFDAFCRAVTKV